MSQSCQFEFRIPFFVVQGRTSTSAKCNNLRTVKIDRELKKRYKHFAESVPKFSKKNEAFGKVITTEISEDGKLRDHGTPCFLLGTCTMTMVIATMLQPKDKMDNGTERCDLAEDYHHQKHETPNVGVNHESTSSTTRISK